MPTHEAERREAVLVFYDAVLEGAREPEDLIWWMIENEMGEATPDYWIYLGQLVIASDLELGTLSQDFKAIVTERALRAYGEPETLAQVVFDNLEGHPTHWWGSVYPDMIEWRSSNREEDKQAIVGHLLEDKMVTVVSAPDWIPAVDEWEVIGEANIDADASEERGWEYFKLFNTHQTERINEAGLIEDHPADYPEEGELPDGWDSALLRPSDDWADLWFDTDFDDFVGGGGASHLCVDKP